MIANQAAFMGNCCLSNIAVRAYSFLSGCFVGEKLARPTRFERVTAWFVARYSIQLSYGRVRGGTIGRKLFIVKRLA